MRDFFFIISANDVDEDVLRRLPDCAAGSLEERLFAALVPSVGHRLKIVLCVPLHSPS